MKNALPLFTALFDPFIHILSHHHPCPVQKTQHHLFCLFLMKSTSAPSQTPRQSRHSEITATSGPRLKFRLYRFPYQCGNRTNPFGVCLSYITRDNSMSSAFRTSAETAQTLSDTPYLTSFTPFYPPSTFKSGSHPTTLVPSTIMHRNLLPNYPHISGFRQPFMTPSNLPIVTLHKS